MLRLKLLFGTGTATRVETGIIQVKMAAGIVNDRIKRLHNYGFMSRPLTKSKAYLFFIGGDTSRGVAMCVEDERHQIELQPGEVAMLDDKGNLVHFTASGIHIKTTNTLTIDAAKTIINSDLEINGHVTNIGGIEIDGLEFGAHTHTGDSGGTTGAPK